MSHREQYPKIFVVALLLLSLSIVSGCTKYKDQIASQADTISQLEADKEKLLAERDGLVGERTDLKSDKANLEDRIAELDGQIESLLEYRQSLEEQLEQLGVDKTKIHAEYTKVMAEQQELIEKMRLQQEQAKERLATLKKMLSKFKSLIEGGKLSVRIRGGKLTLDLPSAVLFSLGEAKLSASGRETLDKVAAVLTEIKDREFQVAGHTDSIPVKGGQYNSNWALSAARAVSVVQFLENKKVPGKYLSAAGYSKYQPTAPNDTAKNQALNRRIEITLMPNLNELPDLSALEKVLKR